MGVLPLHVWLPLAHPVAPVPASAILSGVIVKAGLLGWLRFLPPEIFADTPADPGARNPWADRRLRCSPHGADPGATQDHPRWSTVSQLELLLALFAATLWSPLAREVLVPVLGLWVLHHGLNKAALFLAVGSAPLAGRWRMLLLGLPALSLAGLPLTSGGLAKDAAKAGFATLDLPDWITTAFTLSSITTSLVLLHLYRRLASVEHKAAPAHPAWVVLTLLGLLLPWWWARAHALGGLPHLAGLWSGLWPIAIAVLLALGWWRYGPRHGLRLPEDEMLALWRWLHARLPATGAGRILVQRPAFRGADADPSIVAGLQRLSSASPPAGGGGVLIALTLLLRS
ncbi:MAG: proton-conducting transporter membrane subunit [Gammaproteobacteria bacterium]|nr:proton-conducting transporter membrane subunit [Gammaproteobacteria bacterium]